MLKIALALSLAAIMPALAQSAPIPVFYVYDQSGTDHWSVDKVMHAVLERPDFLAAAKRDDKLLEITISGKVVADRGNDPRGVSFTLAFWRGGAKLGESAEYCEMKKMADCLNQIASDITSANAIRN